MVIYINLKKSRYIGLVDVVVTLGFGLTRGIHTYMYAILEGASANKYWIVREDIDG